MNFRVWKMDCGGYYTSGEQPAFMLPVQRKDLGLEGVNLKMVSGRWVTVGSVVSPGSKLSLTKATTGSDRVRVPMFSYSIGEKSPEMLMASGLQIGVEVALQLGGEFEELHIVIGDVYQTEQGAQFWLGLAANAKN